MKISYKGITSVLAMISPLFLAQNVQKRHKSLNDLRGISPASSIGTKMYAV
ncbi:hypothetical protein [[Scytonema hofmanni] UTEX B 1581]|uniref:hypothetical protein n=1 Tax=[Scytonema hofmanni] UTEX B 1581 TaxID=379535 RepID=UPI0004B52057|nr:hypothetical protein [[Scytonema hofmanni] UTEX B 1581]